MDRAIKNSMVKILLAITLAVIVLIFSTFERRYLFVIVSVAYIVCEMSMIEHLYKKLQKSCEYKKHQIKSKNEYIETLRETIYVLNCEKLDDEKEITQLREIISKNNMFKETNR